MNWATSSSEMPSIKPSGNHPSSCPSWPRHQPSAFRSKIIIISPYSCKSDQVPLEVVDKEEGFGNELFAMLTLLLLLADNHVLHDQTLSLHLSHLRAHQQRPVGSLPKLIAPSLGLLLLLMNLAVLSLKAPRWKLWLFYSSKWLVKLVS